MSQQSSTELKTTPLYQVHKDLGARLVPFAGWHMPIQYAGVMEEHRCVREKVGIFDVSHMGEVEIQGPGALALLQKTLTNDLGKMQDNSILYSVMCYENGGIVDDLIVHRFSENHYFLCINAANTDKDFNWIRENASSFDVEVKNTSLDTAQIAVQGRHAEALLQPLSEDPLAEIRYFHFKQGKIHGRDCIIARTGYTGEDGFELYTRSEDADPLFRKILDLGQPYGIQPAGLGARDTLRMEMGYALYGNDITADTTPLEAGMGWVVKLRKDGFNGKAVLQKQKEEGVKRKLVGLRLTERGVPRPHYPILSDHQTVGELTSGTFSPTLNTGIGLGYVSVDHSRPGTGVQLKIRDQAVPGEVVKPPFVPPRVKK